MNGITWNSSLCGMSDQGIILFLFFFSFSIMVVCIVINFLYKWLQLKPYVSQCARDITASSASSTSAETSENKKWSYGCSRHCLCFARTQSIFAVMLFLWWKQELILVHVASSSAACWLLFSYIFFVRELDRQHILSELSVTC